MKKVTLWESVSQQKATHLAQTRLLIHATCRGHRESRHKKLTIADLVSTGEDRSSGKYVYQQSKAGYQPRYLQEKARSAWLRHALNVCASQ